MHVSTAACAVQLALRLHYASRMMTKHNATLDLDALVDVIGGQAAPAAPVKTGIPGSPLYQNTQADIERYFRAAQQQAWYVDHGI
jgi:hypothetical protein